MDGAWHYRACDARQARFFLKDYYDIESRIDASEEDLRIVFKGVYDDRFCCSQMMVSTPFSCVWHSRSALTVVSGFSGMAKLGVDGATSTLSPDVSVCVSASAPVEMEVSKCLSAGITRFDEAKVRSVCSAWLGTAIDNAPRFSSAPFSSVLRVQWRKVLDLITLLYTIDESVDWPVQELEDYAIGLLIFGHPHELSRFIAGERAVDARAAAEAQAFIDEHVLDDLTPFGVAEALGRPFQALARGFREHRGVTLRQAIYLARRAGAGRCLPTSRHDDDAGNASEKVERLRLHIMGSLSDPPRTRDLAAIAGLGSSRLRALFREKFELTPAQYILNERVNWAHHLLVHTTKSIAEIADETGFSSQAHLNVALKRKLGFTPATLRKSAPRA